KISAARHVHRPLEPIQGHTRPIARPSLCKSRTVWRNISMFRVFDDHVVYHGPAQSCGQTTQILSLRSTGHRPTTNAIGTTKVVEIAELSAAVATGPPHALGGRNGATQRPTCRDQVRSVTRTGGAPEAIR